jgi:hypothetical protein
MLEFQACHALVVFYPHGDHFFPHLEPAAMQQWERIEQEMGHTAWMSLVTTRARQRENWN